MSVQLTVSCRTCGHQHALDLEVGTGFSLTCPSCNATSEGRYRRDGSIVWR